MSDNTLILYGKRVELKRLLPTRANAVLWARLTRQNLRRLERFMPLWCSDANVDLSLAQLHANEDMSYKKSADGYYFIFYGEEPIGLLTAFTQQDETELTYWVDKYYTGRGFATESVRVLETYLFENNAHVLKLLIDPENTPSLKVAGRLGYVLSDTCYIKTAEQYRALCRASLAARRIRLARRASDMMALQNQGRER